MIGHAQPSTTVLLQERGQVAPEPRVHYIRHPFTVPEGATRVQVRLRFHKQRLCQLFLALFDPQGFRGCHMQPGAQGDIDLVLWVAADDASHGGIPGPLPAGEWYAQIDVERTGEVANYLLTVEAEFGEQPPVATHEYPEHYVSRAVPGWYRGELHAHSWESDGKTSVADVVQAAKRLGLDYLALTDHFTTSGYRHLAALHCPDLALIRSLELTGHAGHANLHGLRRWHDVYVDGRDDWNINQLARQVREEGGLFCVNHAFAADLGWRYHEFDWQLADLIEVYHAHEGPGNLLQIGLWDELLRGGQRIVGVAATDSHDPYVGRHRLGQVVTAIYAQELSERGLLDGLRSGRVYGSRGPHVEFTARNSAEPEHTVHMGSVLQPGAAHFRVELANLHYPWRLHILKNGFHFELVEQLSSSVTHMIEFHDQASEGDYYRWELHAVPPYSDAPSQRWREWQTLLAFSNPIFVDSSR
jgi:hypothetical protein